MTTKISVSMPDEMADKLESIRDAIQNEDPLNNKPDRSVIVQRALEMYFEDNPYLEEDEGVGTGNPIARILT